MPFGFRVILEDLTGMASDSFEARKQDIIMHMNAQLSLPKDEGLFHDVNNAIINEYLKKIEAAKTENELDEIINEFLYKSRINFLAYFKYLIGKNDAIFSQRLAYKPSAIISKLNIKNASDIEEIEAFSKKFLRNVEGISKDVSSGIISWDAYTVLEFQRMISGLKTFRESLSDCDELVAGIGEKLEEIFASKDVFEINEIAEILDLLDAIAETIIKQSDVRKIDSKLSRVRFKNVSRDRRLIESCNV